MSVVCVLLVHQAGDATGNPTAGRKLMEAVCCIPQMDEATFESILNSTMQVSDYIGEDCVSHYMAWWVEGQWLVIQSVTSTGPGGIH